MKVIRDKESHSAYINVPEIEMSRLINFVSFSLSPSDGVVGIYAYIWENIVKPEYYLVQLIREEYIIQRLGK